MTDKSEPVRERQGGPGRKLLGADDGKSIYYDDDRTVKRGTPDECCCPVVFGARVTAGHCPIHGAAVLGEDGMREAHAIDRRKRFRVASDEGER